MKIQDFTDYLINNYNENKLSHAFLIETDDILKINNCIKSFFKVVIKNPQYDKLIDEDMFPSLITINKENEVIKSEDIALIKNQFKNISMYCDYNIYIINFPEKMNATSFNKILKFLEEPDDNIIGFLVTHNKDLVADTIISRCEYLNVPFLSEKTNNNIDSTVIDYYNAIIDKKVNLIWYNNNVLTEKINERKDFISFFQKLFDYVKSLSNIQSNYNLLKIIEKYLNQMNYNVNINLMLDSFSVEVGDLYGK